MATAGYVADQAWKFTYNYALCPGYIRFAMAMSSLTAPAMRHGCELSHGQGVTLLIHAACHQGMQWTGTDFNPMHVAFASRLAREGQLSNLVLHGIPLAELAELDDTRPFDVMTNFGTWSWLAREDQAAIVKLARKRLSPEGILCLSHLTRPGQDGRIGLLRIFECLAAERKRAEPAPGEYIPATLEAAIRFLDAGPAFFRVHSGLREMAEALLEQEPEHLAHEFFNYNFRPEYLMETARLLGAAQLDWACSWAASDAVAGLSFSPPQLAVLATVPPGLHREQLKDITLNTTRREDIFARSVRHDDRAALLHDMHFVLVEPDRDFQYFVQTGLGDVALARGLYEPLLETLAGPEPVSFDALCHGPAARWSRDEVADALAILVDERRVQIANPNGDEVRQSAPVAQALNAAILRLSLEGDTVGHLASPLTGGGVRVRHLQRLFLLAHCEGAATVADLAERALGALAGLPKAAEGSHAGGSQAGKLPSRTLVERDARDFLERLLPFYRRLMLLPERTCARDIPGSAP